MNHLSYILAGIRNKPGRNLATIFCFAFIAAGIFSGQYLAAGTAGSIGQGISRMGADIAIVPTRYVLLQGEAGPDNQGAIIRIEPSTTRIRADAVEAIAATEGIAQMTPQVYVATMDLPWLSPEPVDLYGIDPATDFVIKPWLSNPADRLMEQGEVIVGDGIRAGASSDIQIAGSTYTVIGRLDPTRSPLDRTIFFRMDDAYTLATLDGVVPGNAPGILPGDVNAVLIRLEPVPDWFQSSGTLDFRPSYPGFVKEVLRRNFEPTYATAIGRHYSLDPVSEEISDIPDLLAIISGIVVAASFPLIALISSMVARERQREIGLLRSMGARRGVVGLLILAESLALATAGGVIGVAGSFLVFILAEGPGALSQALPVSFQMPGYPEAVLIAGSAVLAVVAIGGMASLYPAYRCGRMNPYEAINSGS